MRTARWLLPSLIASLLGAKCPGPAPISPQCIDLQAQQLGNHVNPWTLSSGRFFVPNADSTTISLINTPAGRIKGLQVDRAVEITLEPLEPPSRGAELHLVHTAGVVPYAEAFDAGGAKVATASANPSHTPQTVFLTSKGIAKIVLTAPRDETRLLQVCH